MTGQFEPLPEYMVSDLDTLKVLSDPFRLRILEQTGHTPISVKRIAGKLGVSPKKLYYHVNLMEKHGLLVVVATQLVSGIVEKWYQARAFRFVVDKSLLTLTEEAGGLPTYLDSMLTGIMEATQEDIMTAARQGLIKADAQEPRRGTLYLQRGGLALTPQQYEQLVEQLEALLESFHPKESAEAPLQKYGFTILVHPLADSQKEPSRAMAGETGDGASNE